MDWLQERFRLNLSLASRLGAHSQPRTHRGTEQFPGMEITFSLVEAFEKICTETPERVRLV